MTVAVFGELALLAATFAETQEVVRLGVVWRSCDDLMASPTDGAVFIDHFRFCATRSYHEKPVAYRIPQLADDLFGGEPFICSLPIQADTDMSNVMVAVVVGRFLFDTNNLLPLHLSSCHASESTYCVRIYSIANLVRNVKPKIFLFCEPNSQVQ